MTASVQPALRPAREKIMPISAGEVVHLLPAALQRNYFGGSLTRYPDNQHVGRAMRVHDTNGHSTMRSQW